MSAQTCSGFRCMVKAVPSPCPDAGSTAHARQRFRVSQAHPAGALALSTHLEQGLRDHRVYVSSFEPVKPPYTIAAFVLIGALAAGLAVFWPRHAQISETEAFTAPGLEPLTIGEAQTEFWRLTPALLLVVYEAFGETQEDAIYDTLASVTHGDALEYLYLERVGAMKGGGLDEGRSDDPRDQAS